MQTNRATGACALLAIALSVWGGLHCGDGGGAEAGGDPCPQGLCTAGAGAGQSSANGAGGQGCVEQWLCTPWDTAGQGDLATRTCLDEAGCGTTGSKPTEEAMLPPLDENYYRCNVEPIFDKYCAQLGCHGVEPDLANGIAGRALRIYHRGRLRVTGESWTEPGCLSAGMTKPSEACIGSVECYCWTLPHAASEWQRNYDSARGFALAPDGTPLSAAAESELLTQPLKQGGLAHAGIKIWTESTAEYQTILDWLNGATLASCNSTN